MLKNFLSLRFKQKAKVFGMGQGDVWYSYIPCPWASMPSSCLFPGFLESLGH
jgi:hypothetical protein